MFLKGNHPNGTHVRKKYLEHIVKCEIWKIKKLNHSTKYVCSYIVIKVLCK